MSHNRTNHDIQLFEKNILRKSFLFFGLFCLFMHINLELGYSESAYTTYNNSRFAYSISYPADLLLAQGEASNNDGQKYHSKDKKVTMLTYGAILEPPSEPIADLYYKAVSHAFKNSGQGKITYKLLKNDFFVISGFDGNDIFYQKTIVNKGIEKTFSIRYDKSVSGIYDEITQKISNSFKSKRGS